MLNNFLKKETFYRNQVDNLHLLCIDFSLEVLSLLGSRCLAIHPLAQ